MPTRRDWIMLDLKTSEMVCNHCKERQPYPIKSGLGYVADVMKAFIKAHKNCRNPERPAALRPSSG